MGFITRSIGRRITKALDDVAQTPEGKAALERVQGRMALVGIALEIAGSGLEESAACAELRKRLSEHPRSAGDAIEHLGGLRTTYLYDRAYRLLTAAVDDRAVRTIDPAVRDQFLAEAKLGRLPLMDGFEYLASLEPRLRELPPRPLADLRQKRSGFTSGPSEPRLVGAWAESPHPVLNTDLAASVVMTYLAVKGGGRDVDHDATPFFERRQRTRTRSFALFGRGDTRPRAQN
jgi:hypothetical protein